MTPFMMWISIQQTILMHYFGIESNRKEVISGRRDDLKSNQRIMKSFLWKIYELWEHSCINHRIRSSLWIVIRRIGNIWLWIGAKGGRVGRKLLGTCTSWECSLHRVWVFAYFFNGILNGEMRMVRLNHHNMQWLFCFVKFIDAL